jgi:type I restriction enzyme, S subunit
MAVWSEIPTSTLVGAIRLDGEFWRPCYLENERNIRCLDYAPLGSLVSTFRKGIFYILASEYAADGVPFYRSSNVGEILPRDDALAYITPRKQLAESKTALHAGDLMIVKTGKSGASVVLRQSCNVSQDVIAVRIRPDRVNPYYLAVYLNSRFGSNEMNRWFQGQVQPHLSLEDARRIWVALPPDAEQRQVESIVVRAAHARERAALDWGEAECLLESRLRLDQLLSNKPTGYAVRLSAVETARRADAQHYQPSFVALRNLLARFPNRCLRAISTYNCRGVQPVYVRDGKYAVVNSQHLGPKHISYGKLERTSASAFRAAPEAHIQPNDLLIYTTGAYVGRTNVYLDDTPALASNHVNILRLIPGIDSAYMSLVLQSSVGQLQTQQHARGSAQAELYPADIDKFLVPLLEPETQSAIGNLVRASLAKQRESARLLEEAKTRVEQLIEEAAA